MKTNNMKYTLLQEEVVDIDAFEEKTHEKIANTIYNLICSKEDGITIGLEGSWGSGKSSVVSILEKKLNKEGTTRLVRFDSWAHEGDPLRRIFLESLINEIRNDIMAVEAELNLLLKKITNRTKIVNIKSKQYATGFGKLLLMSTFLVPLGLGFMTIVKNLHFSFGGNPHFLFLIALIFLSAPLLVLIGQLFHLKFKDILNPDNWIFLEKGSEQTINQEVTEESERSSIEFEKYFEEIMALYFRNCPANSKIVLVVDNLDRIATQYALRILSTLQTFLQKRNTTKDTKELFKKIWIIIPYDQEGLSLLWNENESHDGSAKYFFDKNFQLRLEVPKPIFSNWLKFTKKMVKKALTDCNKKFQDDIVDTLSLTRKDLNDIPTPREIKNYINQVSILLYHTKGEIPTKSISYYVILRQLENHTITKIREKLISNQIPLPSHIPLLPETIKKDISGLIFGVSSDKGYQLLLEPEIENNLANGKPVELKKILDSQGEDFWFVFNLHLKKRSNLENPILYNYSKSIYSALWQNYNSKCVDFIKLSKSNFNNNIKEFKFPSTRDHDGCLNLAQMWEEDKRNIRKHGEAILQSYDIHIGSEDSINKLDVDFLNKVIQLNLNYGLLKEQRSLSNLNLPKLIELYKITDKLDANIWNWIVPTDSVIQEIREQIKPNVVFKDIVLAIKYLKWARFGVDWGEMLSLIQTHINHNNGTFSNHSDEVFEIVSFLTLSDDSLLEKVKSIVTSGQYLNLFFHRKEQNNLFAAITFAYILKSEMHSTIIPNIVNSFKGANHIKSFWQTSNEDSARKVLDYLLPFNQFEFLWILIENSANKLTHDILKIALEKKDKFKQVFICSDCLERMRIVDEIEVISSEEITPIFLSNNDLEEQVVSAQEIDIKRYSKQILSILQNNKSVKIAAHVSSLLLSINEADWDLEFQEGEHLIELSIEIKSIVPDFGLGLHYHDSLYNFIKNLDGISNWKITNWNNIIGLLSTTYHKEFIEKSTQYFISTKENTPSKFIELNGRYLNKEKIFKSPKLYESIVENLLEKNDFEKLGLLLNAFPIEDTKKLLKADKDKKAVILDRIKSIKSEAYEANIELIKQIAELFKIQLNK